MAKSVHVEETKAFAARLRQALEGAGVRPSPSVVAHEFNLRYWGKSITAHTARAWLAGVAIPMQDKLRTLSDWLKVSPDELRFGSRHKSLDNLARELARYMALLPAQRKTVQEVVHAMSLAAQVLATHPRGTPAEPAPKPPQVSPGRRGSAAPPGD
jgi:hypothetical protein